MILCRSNRIGQGIEFDYCVHAAYALREQGYIMVNCNPGNRLYGLFTSDRLFQPLTFSEVEARKALLPLVAGSNQVAHLKDIGFLSWALSQN